MKLVKVNDEFYLLSDESFNQSMPKGTEYYDGKDNIRIWGSGNCYSTLSKNIIASTEKIGDRLLIDKNNIETFFNNDLRLKSLKVLNNHFKHEGNSGCLTDRQVMLVLDTIQELLQDNDKINEAIKWIDNIKGKNASSVPDEHLKTFKTYLQSLIVKNEFDVDCEMEPSNYVVSGGLKPMDEIGGKGLETHWSNKLKVNEQGFITITKIK